MGFCTCAELVRIDFFLNPYLLCLNVWVVQFVYEVLNYCLGFFDIWSKLVLKSIIVGDLFQCFSASCLELIADGFVGGLGSFST